MVCALTSLSTICLLAAIDLALKVVVLRGHQIVNCLLDSPSKQIYYLAFKMRNNFFVEKRNNPLNIKYKR